MYFEQIQGLSKEKKKSFSQNVILLLAYQEFLSTERNSNMWPGNEGTGGGRQQAVDAKQPLLTGS